MLQTVNITESHGKDIPQPRPSAAGMLLLRLHGCIDGVSWLGDIFSMRLVNKTGYVVMLLTAFWQISAQAEVLDDPTAPPGQGVTAYKPTGTKAVPQWVLTSTLIATDRRLANINGTMVGIGTQVAGAHVTAIEPDYVRLRKDNKDLILELLPRDMKQVIKETQP